MGADFLDAGHCKGRGHGDPLLRRHVSVGLDANEIWVGVSRTR
ncbi:hypothetical protein STRAU_0766 [Streptomyces aurantiacus JA 4570]|uniref:Uncharacterized protein n=1 Tax=Streptomyces aurantiacus JA 4570 TaxID=1286094 RepID=S3ZSM6_9ACTN|nr:hypothetical protein STRAU_0766 [Streptomyces aurantiacus JA 4570]